MRDLVLLLGCLMMLPAAFRRAHIGVMLWAWSGFLDPADYVWGVMASVPMNKVFAAVTVLAMVIGERGRWPRIGSSLALMTALLPLGLLSALHSISNRPENWMIFGKLVKVVVLCYVLSMVMTNRLRVHGLLLAIALGLGLSAVWEGSAFLASGGGHHVHGLSTVGDNNQFALAILMLLPIILYLYRQSGVRIARLTLLGAFLLATASVIGTFSRGGFIGLATFAICLIALGRHRFAHLVLVGGLALMVAAVAPESWTHRIDTIRSADSDTSFLERVGAWKMSLLVALDHPFLGGGFHAVQDPAVWASYLPEAQSSDLLTSEPIEAKAHASHDIYLEVLSDLGFPGLALFLGLMASGLVNGAAIKRLAVGRPDLAWAGELASMLQVSIVVYAVAGSALSMAYFELFYLILATLAVVRRIAEGDFTADQQHLAGQRPHPARPHQEVPAQ